MLELSKEVTKGIMFIRLEGDLNKNTFTSFSKELNYLLYTQGIHYYVFNFKELKSFDRNLFTIFQNVLTEIFLSCGKVVMCGLSRLQKKNFGDTKDKLFYVNEENEAFRYLSI